MFPSVFDIFKIGVGPSSSHTMGPMVAAARFVGELSEAGPRDPKVGQVARIGASLHGSLAFTGKGHATDRAVILGFLGFLPDRLDPERIPPLVERVRAEKSIALADGRSLRFDPDADIVFDFDTAPPGHANGMTCRALDASGRILGEQIYYSIGGGFVVTAEELARSEEAKASPSPEAFASNHPHPFASAGEMLRMGRERGLGIAEMKLENEIVHRSRSDVDAGLDLIWSTMSNCIERGLEGEGALPGQLAVKRRAGTIYRQLRDERRHNGNQPHLANDWLCCYAMAVNEENAAGGQIVTAPTNGAAGVVPAVIKYYRDHCVNASDEGVRTFLLTAGAIGALIKSNASISGAEVGCQGEVGSAAAMAAAGFCATQGGANEQIENAAEIALEHHLGMTCDPAAGLVQVPCIERNGMGAVKAVAAASLALRGDGSHFMPLDNCIETMRQTGIDMSNRYKETSLGGLAVNLPEC